MNLINYRGIPRRRVEHMSSLLDDFFGRRMNDFFPGNWFSSSPSINVSENENSYMVEVAAPGLERDDFSIELKDNALMIFVEKEDKEEEEKENYLRKEFSYSSFERKFQLPENVDVDKILAKYEDGILRVEIPKMESEKAKAIKKIEIA